jgi:hypothetical protein
MNASAACLCAGHSSHQNIVLYDDILWVVVSISESAFDKPNAAEV